MELSTTQEATSCEAIRWFPRFLWNLKVHYPIHKSSPPAPILIQTNQVHTTPPSLPNIHPNIIHAPTSSSSYWPLPFWLSPPTTYTLFSSPHSCNIPRPSHPPWLDHCIAIILSEEYKSRRSSLCSFLHSPITSSLFGPNILLSTLFSDTLSLYSSLNVRVQVSHPHTTSDKIILLYIIF
jgi:hypothetical protein